jgi:transcriptional regulator with XRE-family HTH domain
MEQITDTPKRPHHGKNIKRIREFLGMKQEAFADRLGPDWNQGKISVLEARESIEADTVNLIAKALNVAPAAIINMTEEMAASFFTNYNFYDSSVNQGGNNHNAGTINFNPLEKLLEIISDNKILSEKNEKLYEQLLKVEREKNALLEKIINQK